MAYGNVNENFVHFCAVFQGDGKTIANSPLRGIMIVQCDLRVFDAIHFITKRINSRILGDIILVILCSQTSINQRNCNLILKELYWDVTMYWTQ